MYIKINDYSVVVCGVAASGKTTIAQRLASELDLPFIDADDLHSSENLKKMTAGIALDDGDRTEWLDEILTAMDLPVVIACSALKREYRNRLRENHLNTVFLFLNVTKVELLDRLTHRKGHFMPASLLDSQLAIAEPLSADEIGINLDGGKSIEEILKSSLEYIAR